MKIYQANDVDFFVEKPSCWERSCRYLADKTWKAEQKRTTDGGIFFYRDIFGAEKPQIGDEDLYFPCWPKTRLNPGACLPVYWALGQRFIKLEQAKPLGFKCAPFPMNLREVHQKKIKIAQEKKKAAKEAWLQKMLLAECKQLNAGKGKNEAKNEKSDKKTKKENSKKKK